MQIDGLVLSARKGRFVEKIASSIRRTGAVVQKKPQRDKLRGTQASSLPGLEAQGKHPSSDQTPCLGAERFGQVSPDGTVTQFSKSSSFLCEWMFSLGKTGNVGLPWGSAGTGRGLKEWGWGGGEGRGQRPRGLVGLWVPKHLSDIGFCEQMTCLKQLSSCYAHLSCKCSSHWSPAGRGGILGQDWKRTRQANAALWAQRAPSGMG